MLINILGEKFELDALDYDAMVKMENGLENVKKEIGEIAKKASTSAMRQSELVLQSVEVVSRFFNETLGEDASERIFKGKIHYGMALKAFGEFIVAKNTHSGDDISAINNEYTPKIEASLAKHGNRDQRRNANKNKKRNNNPNNSGKVKNFK